MADSSASTIRLLVALPEGAIPVWLNDLLLGLQEAESLDVRAVIAVAGDRRQSSASPILRVWQRLDRRLFLRDRDEEVQTDYERVSIDELPLQDLDAVAWLCVDRPPVELLTKTKFGCVAIADAHSDEYGLAEFLGRAAASECHVIRFGESAGEDQLLATSASTTDRLSLARGLTELRAVANTLLVSTLSKMAVGKDVALPAPQLDVPGSLRIVLGLTILYLRYLIRFPSRFFCFDQWQMAYRIGGERLSQSGLSRLVPDHRGFWADPFMVEYDGRKVLFFEEFAAETGRGHIAAMELQADGQFGPPCDVLVCPYHLSYPFVFEFDGSLFMIPESAEAEKVEVFRCTRFPDSWESHATLLKDIRAYDTTLVEHDGMWWMFMTVQHSANSPNDELHLYYASQPFGEWTPHPLNPVGLDVRTSRPAGRLFRENGRLYRPAQDCSGRYGRAIVIREVRRMTTTDYEEVSSTMISPAWAGNAHATHTVNQAAGVTVYDCEVRRRKRGLSSRRSSRPLPTVPESD